MKSQFIFSFKSFVKRKRFFHCIMFAIIAAFLFEYMIFKDAKHLYNLGNYNFGFFFIFSDNNNFLNLFLISIPLWSILPFGDTYYKESVFIDQILTRTSKLNYILINCCMAFLVAFMFIFIFLGFAYFYNYLFLRTTIENPFYYMSGLFSENDISTLTTYPLFPGILLENPTLYNWIYIIVLSAYAGLLSLTSFSISLCIKNKIISYITPFVITIMSLPITIILPEIFQKWLPHIVFSPRSGGVEYQGIAMIFWIALLLIICFSFAFHKYRRDVLE